MIKTNKEIITVSNDGEGASYFSTTEIALEGDARWSLSEQQDAVNFTHRLRRQVQHQASQWR